MKKYILFVLLLLSACSSKLKEQNELLIPPIFKKEYNKHIDTYK